MNFEGFFPDFFASKNLATISTKKKGPQRPGTKRLGFILPVEKVKIMFFCLKENVGQRYSESKKGVTKIP